MIMADMPLRSQPRLITDTTFASKNIVSYGLIVYARDTQRWAIIQRKHSVDFVLFFKGLYRPVHLPMMISAITVPEAEIIKNCSKLGPTYFSKIYLDELGLPLTCLEYSQIRMAESLKIVNRLLTKLDIQNNTLAWTWPKGRLSYDSGKESPFECAVREFTEEVEIVLPLQAAISQDCIVETVKAIDCRNVESRYWVYVIDHEIPMSAPQGHPEVSNRMWATTEECATRLHSRITLEQALTTLA
jgi:hypothetical protein